MNVIPRLPRAVRLCALLAIFVPASSTCDAAPLEAWVVSEQSKSIQVISVATSTVIADFSIADPDLDGSDETPWGIAFSQLPGDGGTHAFVTQENLLTLIDTTTRTVVATYDLASLLGVPSITLRGVSSAAPRSFEQPVLDAPVALARLFVAGTLAGGEAVGIVLDQQALVSGIGSPLVAWEQLSPSATALDVQALGDARGPRHQRAIFTLESFGPLGPQISAAELWTGSTSVSPWGVGEAQVFALDSAMPLPGQLGVGAPPTRPLPVLPLAGIGALRNLDPTLGNRCDFGGRLVDALVTGPGADSYTVFGLDRTGEVLHVIDPRDCTGDSFTVGEDPVAIATIGRVSWRSVFVVNRGSDDVTRIDDDGTLTTIPLGAGGPACQQCPKSIAVNGDTTLEQACDPGLLAVNKADGDMDGSVDDLVITWTPEGCDGQTQYSVFCQCLDDDPDCVCECDCGILGGLCACSGIGDLALASLDGPFDQVLQNDPHGDPVKKNPWKKLGSPTGEPSFVHVDAGTAEASWAYSITLGDEPLP